MNSDASSTLTIYAFMRQPYYVPRSPRAQARAREQLGSGAFAQDPTVNAFR
jgi:hypothetical protein